MMWDPRADITELSNVPASDEEFHLGLVTDEETSTVLSGDRDPLDRVAEEYVDRCRRGEAPSIAEYEARFPDQVEKVRKLLSAVATMEQLRRGSRQARFMPERIGEFRVLRELGRGGMGVVYEAVQESLWRHVAVKAIHHSQLDSKRLQRFQREAQAVAQLHHTNIVPIFGVGEHDGVPYYAMQYIKGRGLDAVLDSWRKGNAPANAEHWRAAARYAMQAAGALGYAHEQGVFHRDIKPSNLLIDEQDAVWITDFGLAKMVGHEELTASGDVIGTLRYLAPESLRGISEGRSDVYSLGLTLYELLTLSPPYGDLSPSELLHKVSDGQPVRPRNLDPAIPRDLETIVLKATARDLKDRYLTAQALASDLECFLHDRPIQARRATLFERAWRWSRRNRGIAALAALFLASLIMMAVVGWTGYLFSSLAFQEAKSERDESNRRVQVMHRMIREVSAILFADEEQAEDATAQGAIPLHALMLLDETTPRTFSDGSDLLERGLDGPGGPGGLPPDGPGPGPGPGGPPPGEFDGGPPPDGDMRGGEPQFGPFESSPEDRTKTMALLGLILEKYEQLALSRDDKVYPEFQSEIAWLYLKMANYNERIGNRAKADQAFDRSLMIYDKLSADFAQEPRYFRRFFKVVAAINPYQVDPTMQVAVAKRLQRIEHTLNRFLTASPNNIDCLRARMQLLAKLGLLQYARYGPDVKNLFHQALEIAETLIKRSPEEGYPHSDRSDVLEAHAIVLEVSGQSAAAARLLNAAMEDLEWVAADGLMSESLATRMESLADDFKRLGDQTRSDEIQVQADKIDPRPPLANRPRPGRPFAPRREATGPPLGEAAVDAP